MPTLKIKEGRGKLVEQRDQTFPNTWDLPTQRGCTRTIKDPIIRGVAAKGIGRRGLRPKLLKSGKTGRKLRPDRKKNSSQQ